MAKKKKYKQRAGIGSFGKEITRRSKGACELCEGRESTRLWELPPFPLEISSERLLMTCGRCRTWLETSNFPPIEAHFLTDAIWKPEPIVQLAAAKLLMCCDDLNDPWIMDALEMNGIDPKTCEFVQPST